MPTKSDPPAPKPLHINDFPVDLRAELDEVAARSSFSLRVTVLTLIREALITRRNAA